MKSLSVIMVLLVVAFLVYDFTNSKKTKEKTPEEEFEAGNMPHIVPHPPMAEPTEAQLKNLEPTYMNFI